MIEESRLVDGVLVLRILRLLSQDIEETDAYKYGIVDKDGKKIKDPDGSREKDSYTILNRFVFKLKRALMKSPDKNARRLLTVAAALSILKEQNIDDLSEDEIDSLINVYETFEEVKQQAILLEHSTVSFKNFREEMAANAVGGGGIDGIGVGPKGEPGRDPVMMPMIRRKKKNAT